MRARFIRPASPIAHRPLVNIASRRSFRRSMAARAARHALRAPRNHTEMLRISRPRRNAGLRRRAPARPAVPRHQPTSRRSPNATGTDDRAALAAQPRPGAQEGGCGAAASSSCSCLCTAGPEPPGHAFFAKSKSRGKFYLAKIPGRDSHSTSLLFGALQPVWHYLSTVPVLSPASADGQY